ncbi:MAG TPA: GNAT family N-acetyltransferase [Candidatus Limnocylindrales bacterium]
MTSTGRVRWIRTEELTAAELAAVRALLLAAFGPDDYAETDWTNALGGTHFLVNEDSAVVAHASVVERELRIGERPGVTVLRTGYVEAVATAPERQGRGLGTIVMEAATDHIRERYELGALDTSSHHFYERLGWQRWRGQLFVRTQDGEQRTPEEEGYVLVLRTPTSPLLDLDAPMSCDWRPGDVW